jgi:hypothetical protein
VPRLSEVVNRMCEFVPVRPHDNLDSDLRLAICAENTALANAAAPEADLAKIRGTVRKNRQIVAKLAGESVRVNEGDQPTADGDSLNGKPSIAARGGPNHRMALPFRPHDNRGAGNGAAARISDSPTEGTQRPMGRRASPGNNGERAASTEPALTKMVSLSGTH